MNTRSKRFLVTGIAIALAALSVGALRGPSLFGSADAEPPLVALVNPDPNEPEVFGAMAHVIQVFASDAASEVASVEWQPLFPPVELEVVPPPDSAAWKAMTFNPSSGVWEAPWQAPVIVVGLEGFLFARATDTSGNTAEIASQFGVDPNGREFLFFGANRARLRGSVTVEPIGVNGGSAIGVEFRGDRLQSLATFTLSVIGGGVTETFGFVAADGKGKMETARDTDLTDEFDTALTVSGPGFEPPPFSTISLVKPDPGNLDVLSGDLVLIQADIADMGRGVARAEWQLQFPPVEPKVLPPPDPAAWQPLAFNPTSGRWQASWQAPVIVLGLEGFLYLQWTDNLGATEQAVFDFEVSTRGRDFVFITMIEGARARLRGTVTIEPIGVGQRNRIGIEFRGNGLVAAGVYTLTVSGEGISFTVSFTADAARRGEVTFEADTAMTDEFAAALSVSGPGFG